MTRRRRTRPAGARRPDPTPPLLAVIVAHDGNTRAAFTFSLLRLMLAETCRTGRPPGLIWQRFGSGQLVDARNETARHFLDELDPAIEWALFIDADMGFADDLAQRLLAAADPATRPVVGALAFALRRQGSEDDLTQAIPYAMAPTIYSYHDLEREAGFRPIVDYPRDALVQVAATGMACLLVHRGALVAVRDRYGTFFDRIPNAKNGTRFGEDLSFCIRLAGVDVPIWVDTSAKTAHDKVGIFLDEARFDDQQRILWLADAQTNAHLEADDAPLA